MNCWCNEVEDYLCINCQADKDWSETGKQDKIKLTAYKRLLLSDTFNFKDKSHLQLFNYIQAKNLCVSIVPCALS